MAKLADAPDLGSGAARRVGSTPIIRTEWPLTGPFLISPPAHRILKLTDTLSIHLIYNLTSFRKKLPCTLEKYLCSL